MPRSSSWRTAVSSRFLNALAAHLLKVAVDGVALRHGELGEGIVDLLQLQVAALGNLHGPLNTSGESLKRRAISSALLTKN